MFTEEYWLPAGVTWTSLAEYANQQHATVVPKRETGSLFRLDIIQVNFNYLFMNLLPLKKCDFGMTPWNTVVIYSWPFRFL